MNAHARHVHEIREAPIGLRRRIEETIEWLVDLLDQMDALAEDLEDDECEDVSEDEGAQCDDEGEFDGDADLGWTVDGIIGVNDEGKDEDFVTPETSGGFGRPAGYYGPWVTYEQHAWMRTQFDPRIGRRRAPGSRLDENCPIPPFPHESDDRPPFDLWREIPRLLAMASRQRLARRLTEPV